MADFEHGSALPEEILGRMLTSPVLPPSSIPEPADSRWKLPKSPTNSDDGFQVTYSISAVVSVGKRRIASATRKFNFIPISQPQPPISSCDFPEEYYLSSSRETRSMNPLGKCHCTNLDVQSEEPEPLTIRTMDSKGSTRINLMIKLEGRQADFLPKHCKVKTTLITRTFVTPYWHGKWVPTLQDAGASPSANIQMGTSNEQTYTMDISHWEALDRKPGADCRTFLATLPVRFFACHGQLPSASFFTPLLSRRHALDVTVSFPEIRRSEMGLSLPLQVVYSDDAGALEALRLVSPPPQQVQPLQSRHLAGVMLAA
ncbi:hypothetical protein Tdes44962_MAKER02050 [Teratosphaeria destructans]|uniref:Uncharacterized protein n=1 Tax=Teratosphaeria destructans TaxID=418781 RepID=A0A9W7W499_9PEZI|nr:hypothetical protein Tdes44962_MAKER02050 [Teratosphaeria destructans]